MAHVQGRLDGWLHISGLRCAGKHGAYPGERDQAREFLVDLSVRADIGPAAESDDLDDAVDFAGLGKTVRLVMGGESRVLLEKVVSEIAERLLADFPRIEEVRVKLIKTEPQGLGASYESVEVQLLRL